MRAFSAASVLFLSLSAFPFAAKAVSVSELPSTIQSCIAAGSCGIDNPSSYSSERVSAFKMYDASTLVRDHYWHDWLIRYDMGPPSGQTDISAVQPIAFDGYLWMRVQGMYSAAEAAHPVILFMDKVTPMPGPLFNQSGDLSLYMTTADLLAGGAFRTQSDPGYGDYDAGSLSGEIPLICLAEGCGISAQLNLLQLNYELRQLSYENPASWVVMTGFDASDTRGLVYSQSSFYSDSHFPFSKTQTFYISAVPEPSVAWLFGFGLVGVGTIARHRRARGLVFGMPFDQRSLHI